MTHEVGWMKCKTRFGGRNWTIAFCDSFKRGTIELSAVMDFDDLIASLFLFLLFLYDPFVTSAIVSYTF